MTCRSPGTQCILEFLYDTGIFVLAMPVVEALWARKLSARSKICTGKPWRSSGSSCNMLRWRNSLGW